MTTNGLGVGAEQYSNLWELGPIRPGNPTDRATGARERGQVSALGLGSAASHGPMGMSPVAGG
jgi:hypothetical protein